SARFRIILLVVLLGVVALTVGRSFAQATTQPDTATVQAEGLFTLIWGNMDPVFWTIVFLSIAGLTLIIQGFIKNRASVFMPPATTQLIRDMIAQRRFKELLDFTETDPSFISRVLNPALKRASSFSAMKEAMETAIGEQTAEQFRRIEYLNIIGNLGPLLGLLGTVLGMIGAFSAMKAAGGSANPADLAGGISKALAHTFLGLFLAVPCLAAFGVLRTMVDRLTVRGALEAEEILLMLKPTEARPATAPATPRPGATPQPGAATQTRKPVGTSLSSPDLSPET
ncbi:MAG: MotA/TolQ/ExbB proton channel family protein, partial [Tepidisphaeraceae bacterium]